LGRSAQEGIAISRGQATQAFNTASSQNATNFGNAQSAFGDTQNDIGDYKSQLAKFVSSNPYQAGGEYASTVNTGLANVSDSGANSLAGALQSQAKRTGMNSAADAATAASGAQANTRDLSASLASADQSRINSEAGYNTTGLQATATPISASQNLYGASSGAASSALGTANQAAQVPGFWDELGNSFASIPGSVASGVGQGIGQSVGKGCWVAAEIFGGWYEPRTVLVRTWLHEEFSQHRFGRIVVALYMRFGERAAGAIRRYPFLRRVFLPVFNAALRKAQGR
jgi:hypothetical protein